MKWRPATNPEISFNLTEEGEVLSFDLNERLPNKLNVNENTNVVDLYYNLMELNSGNLE